MITRQLNIKTVVCAVAALVSLAACRQRDYRQCSGTAWGTTYHITYSSDRALDDSIAAVIGQVDMTLSPFQRQSVVSLVNRGDTLATHPWLTHIIEFSQQVCSISGGAFDPTLAPLINLWGFGYVPGRDEGPSQEQIDSVMTTVGIMECSVADGQVVKKHPGTEFNFSAIAKGYGVDKIAEMLRRNGCQDYLVEVGGEMSLRGLNPRGEEWRVQVDAPVPADSAASMHQRLAVLQLTDTCIATSGNYRNFREIDGHRIGHTISPVTGRPLLSPTLSATITAGTCALADALATACMAMPLDSAEAMVRSLPGVGAMLVVADADTFKIIQVPPAEVTLY